MALPTSEISRFTELSSLAALHRPTFYSFETLPAMAFVASTAVLVRPSSLPNSVSTHSKLPCRPTRGRRPLRACSAEPQPGTEAPSLAETTPSIPGSLASACELAAKAANAAIEAGKTRLFIEINITSGDETYTMLKNSVPIAKMLQPELPIPTILLPDAGAAALVRRDWPDADVLGLEEAQPGPAIIVTPRASEVAALARLAEDPAMLVVVNPDLVDMGVTGLSLNARRLRQGLIGSFETAYCLKVFPWGVLQRAWPGPWAVWVDDAQTQVGFRLVDTCEERPVGDRLDEILSAGLGDGAGEGVFTKLKRFLSVYMKG